MDWISSGPRQILIGEGRWGKTLESSFFELPLCLKIAILMFNFGRPVESLLSHTAGLSLHRYSGFAEDLMPPDIESLLSGDTNSAYSDVVTSRFHARECGLVGR
jgi:hypothetical protein